MAMDRNDGPLPGGTYKGFSGPLNSKPAPKPRRPSRYLLVGGVAAALIAGLGFGLLARPEFAPTGRDPEPMKAVERAAADPADQFEIEINTPVLDPVPRVDGKLEVLPPDLARAAAERAPTPPTPAPPPPVRVAAAPPPTPVPKEIEPPPPQVARLERPRERPSFDCRYARSLSEEMVCGDPELAAADRHLARAYTRAVEAGVPQRALRAEQDDWLAIRDDAARHSPGAVASVYEQRIDELEALADDRY